MSPGFYGVWKFDVPLISILLLLCGCWVFDGSKGSGEGIFGMWSRVIVSKPDLIIKKG